MTFRAAVIGCGKIGSTFADDPLLAGDVYSHAEAYVRSLETELVAVCDLDAAAAESCARRWGLPHSFTDVARMLSEAAPEIVSVCTPDDTHFAIARQALGAPSVTALLCEKPLATTVEEGEELARLARTAGTTIAVAYSRRYAENMIALAALLENGSMGRLQSASGWYGKGLLHNGSHWIDLLRMLAGDVAWVEAADRLDESGPDPSLDVTLGLSQGGVATLRALSASSYSIFEMDLMLERGRVAIRDSSHTIEIHRAEPSQRYSGYTELVPLPEDLGSMRNVTLRAVDDLADAIRSRRPPRCTAEDGVAALRIVAAARTSARTGRRIEIET